MTARLNDTQVAMLNWLSREPGAGEATNPQRLTARALERRRLVKIKGRGPRWHATLTAAGLHYLEHGAYPPGHSWSEPEPVSKSTATKPEREWPGKREAAPEVDLTVDSPVGKLRRGGKPAGDTLFHGDVSDPYDEKILITVKEAAWMLSLPEHAIRQAVSLGDLDRVFIGEGGRNYRIVYGSLLAWVNSMPRESGKGWW
ncbi:excisionase [Nocardioides sp. NPDC051685]|uniref:excisionase n=1 Tax=Nocardioides sp. NPDC051685 TaxID=3364334 RepID=UPI00378DAE8C